MAHPPLLLAVANACHRDMDPTMRAEVLGRVVENLKDPPPSIASASVSTIGTVNFAMEVLDYLESQLSANRTMNHLQYIDDNVTNQPHSTRMLLFMVGLLCFLTIAIKE